MGLRPAPAVKVMPVTAPPVIVVVNVGVVVPILSVKLPPVMTEAVVSWSSVIGIRMICAAVAELLKSPPRLIWLPVKTKAPAVLSNEMLLNWVPAGKLLRGVKRVVPAKVRVSLAAGATSLTQLAAVVQLLSPPPPSHFLSSALAALVKRPTRINPAHAVRFLRQLPAQRLRLTRVDEALPGGVAS